MKEKIHGAELFEKLNVLWYSKASQRLLSAPANTSIYIHSGETSGHSVLINAKCYCHRVSKGHG